MADNPLQKAPLAVLSAFELKVLGHNPNELGSVVLPIADIFEHYLSDRVREQLAQPSIGIGARTSTTTFTPTTQIWRLLNIGVNLTLDAADTALTGHIQTSITSPSASGSITQPVGAMTKGGATGLQLVAGFYLPRPLLVFPGMQIALRVTLSGNVTAATQVNYALFTHALDI